MSKLIYIEMDSAHDLALKETLENNGHSNDALVKQYIGNSAGANYDQQAIRLYRQYQQFMKQNKTNEAAATADALAYYSLNQDINTKKDKGTEITVKDFAEYRNDALNDAKKVTERKEREVAEQAKKESLAARTPRQVALDNYFAGEWGLGKEGQALEAKVQKVFSDFEGRSLKETEVNIRNNLKQHPASMFDDHDPRKVALTVISYQREIEKKTPSLATTVVAAAVGGSAQAAEAPKAQDRVNNVLNTAYNEIVGDSKANSLLREDVAGDAAFRKEVIGFVNKHKAAFKGNDQAALDAAYADLYTVYKNTPENAQHTGLAAGTALDVLKRGAEYWNAGLPNGKPVAAFGSRQAYLDHSALHYEPAAAALCSRGAGAAAGAAPAQPRSRAYTPIKAEVQYDLALLGLDTGQPDGWEIGKGPAGMDCKNGDKTTQAIKDFLRDQKLEKFDEAAIAKLHTLAQAKLAAAPALAAGASAGRTGAAGPAAGPAADNARAR